MSGIVQQLTRGRLLRGHRGVAGGDSLGRAAPAVSLGDVVELPEGVETGRSSLSLEDGCPVVGRCAGRRKLSKLEEDYLKSLAGGTIAELSMTMN
ncbi:MAG: hypothetical protein GY903_21075 [Fuerstiella sp.]|nr:hypothetical protein [Fuerstiella sp.]MCP4856983.1 hypothetical protein [Fuerstiella sp.]